MRIRTIVIAASLCLGTAGQSLADGDAVAGKVVFRKCSACHTATEPVAKVGPSLMGVVGRPVATFKDYAYSDAMMAFGSDGKVWDEALLSDYLVSPKAMVPGTRMTFAGLKKAQDIADIVAYLKDPAAVQ